MYFSSLSTDTSARRVWLVLLEDLLKQDKALAIFIELRFELS
jgi:flagellar biosynthesis regulator FlaF